MRAGPGGVRDSGASGEGPAEEAGFGRKERKLDAAGGPQPHAQSQNWVSVPLSFLSPLWCVPVWKQDLCESRPIPGVREARGLVRSEEERTEPGLCGEKPFPWSPPLPHKQLVSRGGLPRGENRSTFGAGRMESEVAPTSLLPG